MLLSEASLHSHNVIASTRQDLVDTKTLAHLDFYVGTGEIPKSGQNLKNRRHRRHQLAGGCVTTASPAVVM